MRVFRIAICAALIAAAPLTANARWATHRHAYYHSRGPRAFGRLPRDPLYIPLSRAPPGANCGLGLRDSRGRLRRCAAARAAFEWANPCPSTGRPRGPCPGYVVDHIVPLKRGGADDPANMQWQTIADAKAKDRVE